MRAQLETHYGTRVAPVNEYCQIFQEFFEDADGYIGERYPKVKEAMRELRWFVIGKSSYLDRRLYGGEKRRTVKCPKHDGHWSGLPFPGAADADCPCHLTGWIP